MIGWRPYLLTGLALLLITVAVLDVAAKGRKASPDSCASAAVLAQARFFTQARAAYARVLKGDPNSKCATGGILTSTDAVCVQTQRIAQTDPAEARSLLVTLAETDPRPIAASCVWKQLRAIAPAAAGQK